MLLTTLSTPCIDDHFEQTKVNTHGNTLHGKNFRFLLKNYNIFVNTLTSALVLHNSCIDLQTWYSREVLSLTIDRRRRLPICRCCLINCLTRAAGHGSSAGDCTAPVLTSHRMGWAKEARAWPCGRSLAAWVDCRWEYSHFLHTHNS